MRAVPRAAASQTGVYPMSTSPSSDLALRVLRLEQQLDSYQRLHMQELDALRDALAEVKERVLALASTELPPQPTAQTQ